LLDQRAELVEKVAQEIHRSTSVPVKSYQVDITDAASIDRCLQDVVDTFGHIDVVINSAGIAE
jgi:NADP-dependent 3-hydroxy acid dehydrogenase YdfG